MVADNSVKVIAITLNFDQVEYTKDCIQSLLESQYNNISILLVDNGSTIDNFKTLTKVLPITDSRLIVKRVENNIGYVGGVNYGLKEAKKLGADYFVILNNDTIVDSKAISELVDCSERHLRKTIVSGKVYNYDEKDTLQYIGQSFDENGILNQRSIIKNKKEKDVGQYDSEMEMGMLDDVFWMIPSSLYDRIGPYSDYFYLYGEQNDYGFRALKEGYKFIYTPNAKIWHKGGITTCNGEKKSAKIEYWTSMAVLKLASLHFPEKSLAFNRKWIIRQFLKNLLLFCFGKTKWNNVKCPLIVYKNYRHWNLVRYKDNGYNPFS